MKYISTRGGPTVDAQEAIFRGLSATGGLFIPEKLPEALPLEALEGLLPVQAMALFLHRYLPDWSLNRWEAMVEEALLSLSPDKETFTWPVYPLSHYLERYYLMNGDRMPTGSLADFSAALFLSLLNSIVDAQDSPLKPLIVAVVTDDMAVSALRLRSPFQKIIFVSQNGGRERELSHLAEQHEKIAAFDAPFDLRYREFCELAADEAFEQSLNEQGYAPVFWGPGHILEALTAGALVTASLAVIAQERAIEEDVTYVVHKGHLGYFSGLVYANSLGLPVGSVYVGESEPPILKTLFKTGKMIRPKKKRRSDDPGVSWPVNLERLLFEVSGRDEKRLMDIMGKSDAIDLKLLNDDEMTLLNQSVTVDGNDYKRCLRIIRNIYDQTDYLVGRETADAIACWARHSDKKDSSTVCYLQERSPLLDSATSAKAVLGDAASKGDYVDVVHKLAEETGVPIWATLASSWDGAGSIPALEGSLEATIRTWMAFHDRGDEA